MVPGESLDRIPPDELHPVMIAERYPLSKSRSNQYSPELRAKRLANFMGYVRTTTT
jgi:hypothetical protein